MKKRTTDPEIKKATRSKMTGYVTAYGNNSVTCMLFVQAKDKRSAARTLRYAGFNIISSRAFRRSIIIDAKDGGRVKDMPEVNLARSTRPLPKK